MTIKMVVQKFDNSFFKIIRRLSKQNAEEAEFYGLWWKTKKCYVKVDGREKLRESQNFLILY